MYSASTVSVEPVRRERPLDVDCSAMQRYFHAFGGDDRTFGQAGTSRIWTRCLVPREGGTIRMTHGAHPTIGFWYCPPAARPPIAREMQSIATASTHKMSEHARRERRTVTLTIDGAASNPLLPAAPEIDYHLVITLSYEADVVRYQIKGRHDGFPAFEVLLDDRVVYAFDPVQYGQTTWSLAGWGEWPVDVSGCLGANEACGAGQLTRALKAVDRHEAVALEILRGSGYGSIPEDAGSAVEADEALREQERRARERVTELRRRITLCKDAARRLDSKLASALQNAESSRADLLSSENETNRLRRILAGPCPTAECGCQGTHGTDCHDVGYNCENYPRRVPCSADFRCRVRQQLLQQELAGSDLLRRSRATAGVVDRMRQDRSKLDCPRLESDLNTVNRASERLRAVRQAAQGQSKRMASITKQLRNTVSQLAALERQYYEASSRTGRETESTRSLRLAYQELRSGICSDPTLCAAVNRGGFPVDIALTWGQYVP